MVLRLLPIPCKRSLGKVRTGWCGEASSLGGMNLAVKVVKHELMLSAMLEATLVERVSGHPHLVDLKDTCIGPNGAAYLV